MTIGEARVLEEFIGIFGEGKDLEKTVKFQMFKGISDQLKAGTIDEKQYTQTLNLLVGKFNAR